jgi:DNA-binding XRE family transcriptional regulator
LLLLIYTEYKLSTGELTMFETLKKYRIVHAMSWQMLASMIGLQETYLKLLAGGQMKPGPKTEFKIARFYNEHRAEIEAAAAEYDSIHKQTEERATA